MRDLYKRLRVSQNATADKIREAILLCKNESVRRDAERVLLDSESRTVYDRNLQLLRKIAQARQGLRISHTPNWGEALRLEFADVAASATSEAPGKKGRDGGCSWGCLTIVVLGLCLIGFLIHHNSEGSQYKRAAAADTVLAYKGYLGKNPNGRHADEAQKRIRQLTLEAEWKAFESRADSLGETLNPSSSSQRELFELAAEIVEEMPEAHTGKQASAFLEGSRSRFERQLTTAEASIHFFRLFPDETGADLMMSKLERLAATTDREENLQKIISFLKDIDRLPGVSSVRIEPLRQQAAERMADLYRDFAFVRRLDTKEAYELYLRQVPTGPDADFARRRIVDLEVDEILEGDVGELPELQPVGYANTSSLASVEVSNDTSHSLTVRYSGRDSQKHVIASRQKKTFQIRKGDYRVTATVDAGNVRPYAGNETITYDQYGVSFYIITTRF